MNRLDELRQRHEAAEQGGGAERRARQHKEGKLSARERVELLLDEPPSRGPLSGLTKALTAMQTTHLIVLAIDMPFMAENYLRKLCEKLRPGIGVVPVIENRAEPLAAIYPRAAHEDVVGALSGSDFSLQSLVSKLIGAGKLQAIQLSDEEKAFFRNLNEPGDLERSLSSG